MKRGNCYVTCEALYHLLGGKKAGWKPMVISFKQGDNHWFLQHSSGLKLDPTKIQFGEGTDLPYEQARGKGFLTKQPSKRAAALIEKLLWQ
jgi:hypothetical protein